MALSVGIARLGSTLKFQRAYTHLVDAETAANRFLATRPYHVTQEQQSEPGKLRFWITVDKEPPDRIALAAGDAIHNMRSALDHIVYELSSKTTPDPKRTAFPVQTNASDWDKRTKQGTPQIASGLHSVRYLPAAAQKIIENLQPCPRPEPFGPDLFGPDRERLRQLHEFDIQDKHKNLNVAVTYVQHAAVGHNAPAGTAFPHFEYVHHGPLPPHTPTLLIQLSGVPEMDAESVFAPQIAFSDGGTPGEPIDVCLRELLQCVEMILNALRRFL